MRKTMVILLLLASTIASSVELSAMNKRFRGDDSSEDEGPERKKPKRSGLTTTGQQDQEQNIEITQLVCAIHGLKIGDEPRPCEKRKRCYSSSDSSSEDTDDEQDQGYVSCKKQRSNSYANLCLQVRVVVAISPSTPSPEDQLALRAMRENAKFEAMKQKEQNEMNQ